MKKTPSAPPSATVLAARALPASTLHRTFREPPREFALFPIWYWNDDIEVGEMRRQLRVFRASGYAGIQLMWTVGFSGRIGYLSKEWFDLFELMLREAKRLGLKVSIWDEGGYPSGSANGQVARANPAHLVHMMVPVEYTGTNIASPPSNHVPQARTLEGPASGFWLPSSGAPFDDRMLRAFAVQETAPEVLDLGTLQPLTVLEHNLVRYDLGPGRWRIVALWDIESGATIRGLTPQEEDGRAFAPPAASIINPDAVESFIRLTHERYYRRFKRYFGNTIVAFWTDEPVTYARGTKWIGRVPYPYHPELMDDLQREWDEDIQRWLPALWWDCGPRTKEFRDAYDQALQKRISRVFYARVSRWCADHGVELCGHPACDGEMAHLRYMQLPGQDLVHNYVAPLGREPADTQCSIGREERPFGSWSPTPEEPSAIAGQHSVAAKAASSVALIDRRRRNSSQFGSYGWKMTLDEVKWLFDWHLVRGTNLFFFSSFHYSLRGRRIHQWNGPCMGFFNLWWPYLAPLTDHAHRVSWLLADSEPVCDVAILTDGYFLKWQASAELYRGQVDFYYLYDEPLLAASIEGGRLVAGAGRYRAIICNVGRPLSAAVRAKLAEFQAAGGVVIERWDRGTLAAQVGAAIGFDLQAIGGPQRELRYTHIRKHGRDFYIVVNEGAEPIDVRLSISVTGSVERWNSLTGETQPWPARQAGTKLETPLRLERRQAWILAIDPKGTPQAELPLPPRAGETVFPVPGPWSAHDARGHDLVAPCPGDWAQTREWGAFSGTMRFRTAFKLTAAQSRQAAYLDLGGIGDIAEVYWNGRRLGAAAWAPYVLALGKAPKVGVNEIEVRVTNSMANMVQGRQLPSGLFGPVRLCAALQPTFASS